MQERHPSRRHGPVLVPPIRRRCSRQRRHDGLVGRVQRAVAVEVEDAAGAGGRAPARLAGAKEAVVCRVHVPVAVVVAEEGFRFDDR